MSGLEFSLFDGFECPLRGNCAGIQRIIPGLGRTNRLDIAASASGWFVRITVIQAERLERPL